MRTLLTPGPPVIDQALAAIARARADYELLVEALEDTKEYLTEGRAVPLRPAWGCALVARMITTSDRWVADIIDAEEDDDELVRPLDPALPPGAVVLELVTEGCGERMLLTPRVVRRLQGAQVKLMAITPVIFEDPTLSGIGPDDPLASLDMTLSPQSVHGDTSHPIPYLTATINASSLAAPMVFFAADRPLCLPR